MQGQHWALALSGHELYQVNDLTSSGERIVNAHASKTC